MKKNGLILFLICLRLLSFGQNAPEKQFIYLLDGSVLQGTIFEEPGDSLMKIHLNAGTEMQLPKNQVWRVRPDKGRQQMLSDGRTVQQKGGYTAIGVHALTAKISQYDKDITRWGMGVHFSGGYQFRPWLMLGAGMGVDAHGDALAPVFLEVRGFLMSDRPFMPRTGTKKGFKRRLPVAYGMQWGYNLPLNKVINKVENTEYKGGRLFYPWVGLQFPTRRGTSFQLDAGYKFQRYGKTNTWWGYQGVDTHKLRSFAVRGGWVF